ncbi:hypothetical protein HN832_04595 [archaeon]|jgi:hypothetical protein|nr:hypothetical protein [archaeon]MBT4373968.1 hypothetical protein [archaeon]MBT4532197.1 hypothetical protein [archaeon]MBT7001954.1 hypothetical protein [archaeon]MBT7282665.1 hypothetical protein [archaeon]
MKIGRRGIQVKRYTLEVLFSGVLLILVSWFLRENYAFNEVLAGGFYIIGFILMGFSLVTIISALMKRW